MARHGLPSQPAGAASQAAGGAASLGLSTPTRRAKGKRKLPSLSEGGHAGVTDSAEVLSSQLLCQSPRLLYQSPHLLYQFPQLLCQSPQLFCQSPCWRCQAQQRNKSWYNTVQLYWLDCVPCPVVSQQLSLLCWMSRARRLA